MIKEIIEEEEEDKNNKDCNGLKENNNKEKMKIKNRYPYLKKASADDVKFKQELENELGYEQIEENNKNINNNNNGIGLKNEINKEQNNNLVFNKQGNILFSKRFNRTNDLNTNYNNNKLIMKNKTNNLFVSSWNLSSNLNFKSNNNKGKNLNNLNEFAPLKIIAKDKEKSSDKNKEIIQQNDIRKLPFQNLALKGKNIKSVSVSKVRSTKGKIFDDTNSTSTFANSSKKYSSYSTNNNNNNLTDEYGKYRMGLFSASSSNSKNNIIIPLISFRRPLSNFNFGGSNLFDNSNNNNYKSNIPNNNDNYNFMNEEDNINNKIANDINSNGVISNNNIENNNQFNNIRSIIEKQKMSGGERHKVNTAPYRYLSNVNNMNLNAQNNLNSLKNPKKNFSNSNTSQFKFDYNFIYRSCCPNGNNNLFDCVEMPKNLHKIKIEKGMMNNKIVDSINKKIFNDYQDPFYCPGVGSFKQLPNIDQKNINKNKSNSTNKNYGKFK